MDGNNILTKFFSSLASVIRIKLNSNEEYKPIELANAIEQIDDANSGSIHEDLTCYIGGGIREIKTVIIGENAKKIASYAYSNCTNLKEVIILGNITEVQSFAFDACTSLETINLPDSVKTIGSYAFRSCNKLENIPIPASIQRVESTTLSTTKWYTNQENNSLVYFGPILFKLKGDAPNDGNITLNENVISISGDCFYGKTSVISFRGNVSNFIGNSAFRECTELTEAYFLGDEKGLQLENYVFQNCTKLKTLYFENLMTMFDTALIGCTALTDLYIMNKNALPSTFNMTTAIKNQITYHVHPNVISKWKAKYPDYNIVEYIKNE